MKVYSGQDIARSLTDVGIQRGDVVFFCASLFKAGRLGGAKNRDLFNKIYLDSIREVIGAEGTLVVTSYTQQVARFGLPYHHETTVTPTGVFNEFLRTYPGAVRSFHPVFSLAAVGARAQELLGHVSPNAFAADSAYDFLFRSGAIGLNIGFEINEAHLTTGMHYLECMYALPYYYNKVLRADVFRGGVKSNQVFTLNVRYRDFGIRYDCHRYHGELVRQGAIRQATLGDAPVIACSLEAQRRIGYELLAQDPYAFLEKAPEWRPGEIPFEGSAETMSEEEAAKVNWAGFHMHGWN